MKYGTTLFQLRFKIPKQVSIKHHTSNILPENKCNRKHKAALLHEQQQKKNLKKSKQTNRRYKSKRRGGKCDKF